VAEKFDVIALVTEHRLVPSLLRGHACRFWVASFVAASVVTGVLAFNQTASRKYGLLCMTLLVAAMLLVPAALHFCSSLFLAWARSVDGFITTTDPQALHRWYNTEMKLFEGHRLMFIAGAGLGIVALLAYALGHYFDGFTLGAQLWAGLIVFGSAFLAGCGLFAMYSASVAVKKLGRVYRDQIVVVPGRFGILSTGRVLAQCWMIIGGVWFVYSLSALFGPPHASIAEVFSSYPVLLVALPTLPLIIGSFVHCQLPIHAAMLEYKKAELQRLDAMLAELAPARVADLTKEKQETIEFLVRRRNETEALPEWPFSGKALAGVSGSAVSALLPILLEGMLPAQALKQFAPIFGAE
jgi:hypothetical protein